MDGSHDNSTYGRRASDRPASLLTPDMERRLAGLRFNIPYSMDGRLAGVHRSAQPGVSVEFADHKEYSPGDDIRHLDWKAYARFDRFYVRQFTRDTHANVYLVLDSSGSMDYTSGYAADTKLHYSVKLAAILSYLFLRQNDAVGLLTVRGRKLTHFLPARSHPSHLMAVQEQLARVLSPDSREEGHEGPTSPADAMEFLVARRLIRNAVIVLSDFFYDAEELFPYLAYLKATGNFCWLIQVLDPAEFDVGAPGPGRTFPFEGTTVFRSNETGHGIMMDPKLARQDYISRFAEFMRGLDDLCAEGGIELSRGNSDLDPVEFVLKYLLERR